MILAEFKNNAMVTITDIDDCIKACRAFLRDKKYLSVYHEPGTHGSAKGFCTFCGTSDIFGSTSCKKGIFLKEKSIIKRVKDLTALRDNLKLLSPQRRSRILKFVNITNYSNLYD